MLFEDRKMMIHKYKKVIVTVGVEISNVSVSLLLMWAVGALSFGVGALVDYIFFRRLVSLLMPVILVGNHVGLLKFSGAREGQVRGALYQAFLVSFFFTGSDSYQLDTINTQAWRCW